MKRVLCLLLVALLTLGTVYASAEKYSSEPEKLLLQFKKGSGLKGTLSVNASGTADWARQLSAMNGQSLQLRFLDQKASGFQYRMYEEDEEAGMVCMTEIIGDGKQAYLTSDFLMGKTYTMPATEGLVSAALDLVSGNASWYSLLTNINLVRSADWQAEWAPLLKPFENALESWLSPYLSTEVLSLNGETLVMTRYTIPSSAVKAQLVEMLETLMNNKALLELIRSQASASQISLYLQPNYIVWYQQVVEALPMEGNIILERTTTAQGKTRGYALDFTLAGNAYGLTRFQLSNEGEETEYILTFTDKTWYLSISQNDTDTRSGILRVTSDNGQNISALFSLTAKSLNYTDTDGRHHEENEYVLTAESDLTHLDLLDESRSRYLEFDDITARLTSSFYSKSSDTTPVTASVALDLSIGTSNVQAALTLKSASPWKLPEAPKGPYTKLDTMKADKRSALLDDWFSNGLLAMSLRQPATTTDLSGGTLVMEPVAAEE